MLLNCVLEKTLEGPLDCKNIKPVNPKEINPEYSLEGLMLKPKLQYFGHLMGSCDSAGAAERSYPTSKVRSSGCTLLEQP